MASAAAPHPVLPSTALATSDRSISRKNLFQVQLKSSFAGRKLIGSCISAEFTRWVGTHSGWNVRCWFKFGKSGVDAEGAGIYGSQRRDEFERDDVEQVGSLCLCEICICP
eukprot:Gb_05109 [translate_table: standard]